MKKLVLCAAAVGFFMTALAGGTQSGNTATPAKSACCKKSCHSARAKKDGASGCRSDSTSCLSKPAEKVKEEKKENVSPAGNPAK